MDLSLDQLRTLDAIERTGTFARAAAELHKVPSAVSYAVRTLEEQVGVPLFDRRRRRARLTAAGRAVLDAGREVLNRAAALERLASDLRDGWEPELRVVVDGALPMAAVTRCIRRFSDPEIPTRLRLDVEYQEGVLDRFLEDDGDIAMVIGLEPDEDETGFLFRPLPELELLLVAAASHPLTGRPATPVDLANHAELVVRDSSPRFAKRAKGSFLGSRNLVYLSDFHSKRLALLDGAGYGWIPRHFIDADLRDGSILRLEREGATSFVYRPQLVTRAQRSMGRAARLFLEELTGKGSPD